MTADVNETFTVSVQTAALPLTGPRSVSDEWGRLVRLVQPDPPVSPNGPVGPVVSSSNTSDENEIICGYRSKVSEVTPAPSLQVRRSNLSVSNGWNQNYRLHWFKEQSHFR